MPADLPAHGQWQVLLLAEDLAKPPLPMAASLYVTMDNPVKYFSRWPLSRRPPFLPFFL